MTDPCREGKAKCGEHSNCVVDGDEFKCICDRGYEFQYREVSSSEIIECGGKEGIMIIIREREIIISTF